MKSSLLMGFAAALLAAVPAVAHHSFGAEYDGWEASMVRQGKQEGD